MSDRHSRRDQKDPRLFMEGLAKGLAVLEILRCRPHAPTLTEIANETGYGISGTQRLVHTLTMLGYVLKDERTRCYTMGVRVLGLAGGYLVSSELLERAFPHLLDLSRSTEETVNLTELVEGDVIYVVRLPGRKIISTNLVVGSRLPAFCTAPGRALLSKLPPQEREHVVAKSKLEMRTPKTVVDRASVMGMIDEADRNGYAVADQETFVDDISIASPIVDKSGRAIGAVNIAVSAKNWEVDEAERVLAPLVVRTAAAVSKQCSQQS